MIRVYRVLTAVVIAFLLSLPVSSRSEDRSPPLAFIEGTVPHLTLTELFLGNMRFLIAKDVEVFLHKESGRRISIKELVGVGRIERAKIFLNGGTVVKIVVLEMVQ